MREVSDRADEAERSPGRIWPLAIIAGVIGWLLLSGGSATDWFALRGPVPGTGGVIAKGHLVLIGLILLIGSVVFRMPREGGPLAVEERPEGDEPPE